VKSPLRRMVPTPPLCVTVAEALFPVGAGVGVLPGAGETGGVASGAPPLVGVTGGAGVAADSIPCLGAAVGVEVSCRLANT
jgi:hypothetical protein